MSCMRRRLAFVQARMPEVNAKPSALATQLEISFELAPRDDHHIETNDVRYESTTAVI